MFSQRRVIFRDERACQRAILRDEIDWPEYERRIACLVRETPGALLTEFERRKGVRYLLDDRKRSERSVQPLVLSAIAFTVGLPIAVYAALRGITLLIVLGAFVMGLPAAARASDAERLSPGGGIGPHTGARKQGTP